jgi:hypothetical protein
VPDEWTKKFLEGWAETGGAVLIPKLERANARQGLGNMAFRGMRRESEHSASISLWGGIT